MAATIEVKNLVVAGLNVEVYADTSNASSDVAALFLLHGRTQSKQDVKWVAESVLNQIAAKRGSAEKKAPELIIVAFVSGCDRQRDCY